MVLASIWRRVCRVGHPGIVATGNRRSVSPQRLAARLVDRGRDRTRRIGAASKIATLTQGRSGNHRATALHRFHLSSLRRSNAMVPGT